MQNSKTIYKIIALCLLTTGLSFAQPGGEQCVTSTVIPGLPFNGNGVMGNNDDCPNQPFRDVFYTYTAAVAGNYTASLCGSAGNTMLRIFTAGTCCAGPMLLGDDVCGDDPSIVFPMVPAQTVIFELGYASPASPIQPYLFTLTGPPPCAGTMALLTTDIFFPPTQTGGSVSLPVQISNNSPSQSLCIADIHTNGSIWSVDMTSFIIPPNQVQQVMITFAPTFEHDFLGTITIAGSDPANMVDSILVEGRGYRAPQGLLDPPTLIDAGAWNAIYFTLPFEDAVVNSYNYSVDALKIAVQYSADNFTNWLYVKWPEGVSETPDWATGSQWGIGSQNVVLGLDPDTDYQVRYIAQDPQANEIFSQTASYHTPPAPFIKNPNLTAKSEADGSVTLNWDPVLKDSMNLRIVNYGYWLYEASHSDSPAVPIEFVALGLQSISAPLSDKKFYYLEPQNQEAWVGAKPLISWPPANSICAGEIEIILKDFIHLAEWDSFTIEDDFMGDQYLLGSNLDNSTSLQGEFGAIANLSDIGIGPHMITATVVDKEGTAVTTSISVNVVEEPYATFDATYDSGAQQFSLAEISTVIPTGFTQAGTLWPCSHVGERYGNNISLHWSSEYDSLMLVKVQPRLNEPLVYQVSYDQQRPFENAGIAPNTTNPNQPYTLIRCCCLGLSMNTAGQAEGKYSGFRGRLGAIADCDNRSGEYQVGFGFEVEREIQWELSPTFSDCIMGQDAKGTRDFSSGSCKNQTNTCTIAKTDTIKKRHGGNSYGYTESLTEGFGNDGYGPKGVGSTSGRNRGARDESGRVGKDKVKKAGKASGTLRYYDVPSDFGTLPKDQCFRDKAKNMFMSKVEPHCTEGMECCLMFKIEWDVTMCKRQNQCHVTQTQAPTLTPIAPPGGGCAALAP